MDIDNRLHHSHLPAGHNSFQHTISVLLLLAIFITPWTVQAEELRDYRQSTDTPSLELLDIHGNTHSLKHYSGNVVLVNFWAGWCFPCIQEIPDMIRLAESMADKAFTILAINVGEEKNRLPGFTKKMDEHMVVLLDTESETFERWKGIGLPSSFVLDPEGKIRHVAYGPVDWDRADIIKAFTTLINSHEKNNTSQ